MFYILSKAIDVLLSPLAWALLLWLAAWQWQRPKASRLAFAPGLAGPFVLCLFSLQPVSNRLARSLESAAPRAPRTDAPYDAVILLGGAVDQAATEAWGEPCYNDNVERLLTTLTCFARGARAR